MHLFRVTTSTMSRRAGLREFGVSAVSRRTAGRCLARSATNDETVRSSGAHVAVTKGAGPTTAERAQARDFVTSSRLDPPQPRRLPLIGTMLSLMLSGGAHYVHEYVDKRHQQYGPVYRDKIGPVSVVFVSSPNEFRRVFLLEGPTPRHHVPEAWIMYNNMRQQNRGLLFMDGKEWLFYRRVLNKSLLTSEPLNLMVTPCQEAAENLVKMWRPQSRSNATITNLEHQLYQWSIDVMLATLVGSQWNACKDDIARESRNLAMILHQIFVHSANLAMMPAKLAKRLRLPSWTNFVASADMTLATVRTLVPEMLAVGGDGLLRTMMNDGIGHEDAIRIVADFIMAAGDTTAVTIQWALLLLSGRPELQAQLAEETRGMSPKDILQHTLIKGVTKEALRLYPIAPFITRYLPQDSLVGGYFVPKGELVSLSLYSSGRDPKNFPNPKEFLPERWIKTDKNTYQGVINPYATVPFAMGVRSCIGRKLAETQIALAIAKIVQNFKVDCTNMKDIKMILHLISVPSKPIQLKLTERI